MKAINKAMVFEVLVVTLASCNAFIAEPTETPAAEEKIRAAALQFVRKVSGYRKPSKVNEEAFERAVEDVAETTQHL